MKEHVTDGKRVVHMRLDTDLVVMLDDEAERLKKATPGLDANRNTVLRIVLREWAMRREHPRGSKSK